MGKKLRVGNIGSVMSAEGLETIFSEFGAVKSTEIAASPYSGIRRGFGYVEMATEKDAAECILKLHGADREGQTLDVTEAPVIKKKSNVRSIR